MAKNPKMTPFLLKLKNKGKIHLQIILFKITADCVYVGEGGAGVAARKLNIDEHQVIKTLVMENQRGDPVLIISRDQEPLYSPQINPAW